MGGTGQVIGKGGRVCPEVDKNLLGGGPVGSAVWVRDVGDDTTDCFLGGGGVYSTTGWTAVLQGGNLG